jgi:hypothetical protein
MTSVDIHSRIRTQEALGLRVLILEGNPTSAGKAERSGACGRPRAHCLGGMTNQIGLV